MRDELDDTATIGDISEWRGSRDAPALADRVGLTARGRRAAAHPDTRLEAVLAPRAPAHDGGSLHSRAIGRQRRRRYVCTSCFCERADEESDSGGGAVGEGASTTAPHPDSMHADVGACALRRDAQVDCRAGVVRVRLLSRHWSALRRGFSSWLRRGCIVRFSSSVSVGAQASTTLLPPPPRRGGDMREHLHRCPGMLGVMSTIDVDGDI